MSMGVDVWISRGPIEVIDPCLRCITGGPNPVAATGRFPVVLDSDLTILVTGAIQTSVNGVKGAMSAPFSAWEHLQTPYKR